jgi:hypothetical protein
MDEIDLQVRDLYYKFQEEYSRANERLLEERRAFFIKEFDIYLSMPIVDLYRRKLERVILELRDSS